MDTLGFDDVYQPAQLRSAFASVGGGASSANNNNNNTSYLTNNTYDMRVRRSNRPQWSESSNTTSSQASESEVSSIADDDDEMVDMDDDDEVHEYGVDANEELPEFACAYCGYHDPLSCAMCTMCNKWFCNGKDNTSGSHIVTHLVFSKHTTVALHADGPLGDAPLECYVCGAKNIFSLGFVPSKQDGVVVVMCREPCLHSPNLRDMEWDPDAWLPLIEEKRLLPWLCAIPTGGERERQGTRHMSNKECRDLEALWKQNASATAKDFLRGAVAGGDDPAAQVLPSIPYEFRDGHHYRDVLMQFITAECNACRETAESLSITGLSATWSTGLQKRKLAAIQVPPEENRITIGDEVVLSQPNTDWEAFGVVVRIQSAANMNNEMFIELKEHLAARLDAVGNSGSGIRRGAKGNNTSATTRASSTSQRTASRRAAGDDDDDDTSHVANLTLKSVFKAVNFDRQRSALKTFVNDDQSVTSYLFHSLLGQPEASGSRGSRPDVKLPEELHAPNIAKLNSSQTNAVRMALTRNLTLIQGPPGTGKTSTSATIVYHMCTINNAQVLVCSPSNVAVDQLAERLEHTGLTVVRLYARSRESIETSINHLALHNQVRQFALSSPKHSELHKLFQLKEATGDLTDKDRKRFTSLIKEAEHDILVNCDVVCTTCSGAGDARLSAFCFRHVLIDESTQAVESDILIPLVMGSSQLVLVGDHCQMGPVIMSKPAEEAGYNRSLFERLIQLNHRPIRLEVQYRMHPALSEFSSNAFYEGTLQNGVTAEDRDASRLFPWPNANKPMFFYNSIHPEEISASGTSFLNRTEAALAEKMATTLLRSGVQPDRIGIITPYEGQRNFLVQYMNRQGQLGPEAYRLIEIASVDSFQGREKEFVILTCVRSNEGQGIGFLADWRRLNVALTRARRGVMIIGNARVLSRHILWHDLLSHYQKSGLIVEGPVQQLVPVKVALQKPRLTAQVVGPRSTLGLNCMYQGSIGMGFMEDPMHPIYGAFAGNNGNLGGMGGGPAHGGHHGHQHGGGGGGGNSYYARSYSGRTDDTGSISSSQALVPYFDTAMPYVPGEGPSSRAHQYGGFYGGIGGGGGQHYPASQQSNTGWSTPSQHGSQF